VNVYSVTVEWETIRESQMTETLMVLAPDIEAAKVEALRFIEERTGYDGTVTRASMVAARALKPRILAQLALDANDRPYWVNR